MGKGWSPTVGLVHLHEVISHASSNFEVLVIELRVSIYIQIVALLAYSCTLIGLSVGNADRSNAPPPTQVLFRQGNVEKNRRHIKMYYPRPPDHQQPSRKGPRIPARSDMCTSVAPGFPTRLVTSVTPPPHSPDRPDFRMASTRTWAGGGVRRRASLRTPPPRPRDAWLPNASLGKAGGASGSREWGWGGHPGPQTCPWPGGRVSGRHVQDGG